MRPASDFSIYRGYFHPLRGPGSCPEGVCFSCNYTRRNRKRPCRNRKKFFSGHDMVYLGGAP